MAYYYRNDSEEKDLGIAFELYKIAVEMNDNEALRILGVMYEKGEGVEKDVKQAVECYQKAAEKNDCDSMTILGYLYLNGVFVEANPDLGIKWLKKSHKLGNYFATNILSFCYKDGLGVKQDLKKAEKYCIKSALSGHISSLITLFTIFFELKNESKYIEKGLDVKLELKLLKKYYSSDYIKNIKNIKKNDVSTKFYDIFNRLNDIVFKKKDSDVDKYFSEIPKIMCLDCNKRDRVVANYICNCKKINICCGCYISRKKLYTNCYECGDFI